LKLNYLDKNNNTNTNNIFGIIQKVIKLKEDDNRVMEIVKKYLKTLSTSQKIQSYSNSFKTSDEQNKNEFLIYELYIHVKIRHYVDTMQSAIDYEVKHFCSNNSF